MTTNESIDAVNWNRVVAQLGQILELRDRTDKPGEAEAAAAAYTRLLVRYNLTEADVQSRLDQQVQDDYVVCRVHDVPLADWAMRLFTICAWHNFGRVVRQLHPTTSEPLFYMLLAKRNNVKAILDLLKYLLDRIDQLVNAEIDRAYDENDWVIKIFGAEQLQVFARGIVDGIEQAMAEAKEAEVGNFAGGTALVQVIDDELDAERDKRFGTLRPKEDKPSFFKFSESYHRGFVQGHALVPKEERRLAS